MPNLLFAKRHWSRRTFIPGVVGVVLGGPLAVMAYPYVEFIVTLVNLKPNPPWTKTAFSLFINEEFENIKFP